MLAGVIEETGILLSVKGGLSGSHLVIRADRILENIEREDSTTINGVCLAVASFDSGCLLADMMPETLKCSNLDCLSIKSSLNLKRVTIVGGRFGGHIASGHIDETGTIVNVVRDSSVLRYTIRSAPSILRRIIEKGSTTIDGVSLMVAQIREQDFSVSLIPHAASHTTLEALRPGRAVNLENNCVGKRAERFTRISPFAHNTEGEDAENKGTNSRVTPELLKQCGF